MKIKCLLTSITILLSCISYAQDNFLPGQITTTNGQTTSGFIDYRNWELNPSEISFKKSISSEAETFTTSDLVSFTVANDQYISASTVIERSSRSSTTLDDSPSLKFKNINSFLQTLYKGSKSLFYHRSEEGIDSYYILDEEGKPSLLEYKKYRVNQEGKRFATEINNYKSQLIKYLTECPEVKKKFNSLQYKQSSLVNLFESYYQCTGQEVTHKKEIEKAWIDYGVMLGVSQTSINFDGTNFPLITVNSFENPIGITGGGFLEITPARNRRKWSFRNELLYSYYKANINRASGGSDVADLDFAYVKLNLLVGYKYLLENSHINFHAGFAYGYAIKSETPHIRDLRKFEQGLLFGLGYAFNKVMINVRYEDGNGMSPYANLKSEVNRISLLVSYKI